MTTVIVPLQLNAANFRAEIARHQLEQWRIAERIGMHPTLLSHYLNERRDMSKETAELIASALNEFIAAPIFRTKTTA